MIRTRKGMSLLELLVVIAITSLLVGLMLPAIQKVRQAAGVTRTANNLRQTAIATHSFHDANGQMPVPWYPNGTGYRTPLVQILPYIEESSAYGMAIQNFCPQYDFDNLYVPSFQSPLDGEWSKSQTNPAPSNIVYNLNVIGELTSTCFAEGSTECNALMPVKSLDSIEDGTSNTILLATKYAMSTSGVSTIFSYITIKTEPPYFNTGWPTTNGAYFGYYLPDAKGSGMTFQTTPPLVQRNFDYAHSLTGQGIQVALADGSCRTIASNISGMTWRNAMLPNDGVPLGGDWLQ